MPPEPHYSAPQPELSKMPGGAAAGVPHLGLPPNVSRMEKQIAARSSQKSLTEMNSKRLSKQHKFLPGGESAATISQKRFGSARVQSSNGRSSGEYMQNTVNADIKLNNATTNKAKLAMV